MAGKALGRVILVLAVLALLVGDVKANEIFFGITRSGTSYEAAINGQLDGVISVRMQKQGDTDWDVYDTEDDVWFDLMSGAFGDLALLLADVAGNYNLEFVHAGGTSLYSFSFVTAQAEWFPTNPVLNAVPAFIPQQYQFSWQGSTGAQMKDIDSWAFEGDFELWEVYYAADPGFLDLHKDVDFGDYVGGANFSILYAVQADQVASLSHVSGLDVFGDNKLAYLASEDSAQFQVVPEPASFSLLALGALALLRRRKK